MNLLPLSPVLGFFSLKFSTRQFAYSMNFGAAAMNVETSLKCRFRRLVLYRFSWKLLHVGTVVLSAGWLYDLQRTFLLP